MLSAQKLLKRKNEGIRRYSLMFLLAAAALLMCFVPFGRTMISSVDGFQQHYTVLAYLRQAVRDLLAGNGIKMVDLQIGQGMDVIGTFSYYGLMDPINLVAVLFPQSALELAYTLIILLRLYLVGLFFCMYLKYIGLKDAWGTSIGALTYAFAGFFLKTVVRHPFFSDGGIFLSLMLIAVERFLQNRKWLMFVLVTAVMLAANYYFAFMTTILVIVYILVRIFSSLKKKGVRRCAADGFLLCGMYILGAALSAVVFFPVVISFLGNVRGSEAPESISELLHYNLKYYYQLLAGLCTPKVKLDSSMYANLCPPVFFALLLLFSGRKGKQNDSCFVRQLRIFVLIVFVFACVPLFGKFFNGMGYITNRWSYGFAFPLCVAVAWAIPQMMGKNGMSRRMRLLTLGYMVVVLGACLVLDFRAVLVGELALGVFLLFFHCIAAQERFSIETKKRLFAVLTLGCCIVYICSNYVPVIRGGVIQGEFEQGRIADRICNDDTAPAGLIETEGFHRVDTGRQMDFHQTIHDYYGLSHYWSIVPDNVFKYYNDLNVATLSKTFQLYGMGGSSSLDALAGVGYCVRNEEMNEVVPFGFEKVDSLVQDDGDRIHIYENQYKLPLGYVFYETLSRADYDALNSVEKRVALLSGAVLESPEEKLPAVASDFSIDELDWSISDENGVQVSEHTFLMEENGSFQLNFDAKPDHEVYVMIEGIGGNKWDSETDRILRFSSEAGTSDTRIVHDGGRYYFDREGVCVCLGYSEAGMKNCIVSALNSAELHFEDIHVYSFPMSDYREKVDVLIQNGLQDVQLENNRISGKVSISRPGVLQISVPYNGGWTATVDGEAVDVFQSGGMYTGVRLEAGNHKVELNYVSPGLKEGVVVSAIAVAIIVLILLVNARRRRMSVDR